MENNMTPEKQRIEIAKECKDTVEWHDELPYWKGLWSSLGEGNEYMAEFNPLTDLNACHEMEKELDHDKSMKYWGLLIDICNIDPATKLYHSNSTQRCEAFLKTIGKWEES